MWERTERQTHSNVNNVTLLQYSCVCANHISNDRRLHKLREEQLKGGCRMMMVMMLKCSAPHCPSILRPSRLANWLIVWQPRHHPAAVQPCTDAAVLQSCATLLNTSDMWYLLMANYYLASLDSWILVLDDRLTRIMFETWLSFSSSCDTWHQSIINIEW